MSMSNRVLLIAGDDTCYNALNEFALSFEEGLMLRGYDSDILYIKTLDREILDRLVNSDYMAIVGFQTNLFTLEVANGIYVGNMIQVPKYNYIFDSPITKRQYFEPQIKDLTFFYHDIGYIGYLEKYFPNVSVIYNPPAGGVTGYPVSEIFNKDREYELTFVGSYSNYRDILNESIRKLPDWADIIVSFFEYLIQNPDIGVVRGIEGFIEANSLDIAHEEIPALLEILYPSENAAKSYYREKVIKVLLDGGLRLDVFSESFKAAPFADHMGLRIHPDISYRDSMKVMADSKVSLNIFSWHKDSMTERIANIMLGGAVCVSDNSSKLSELFHNNEDIVIYDLGRLEELPDMISNLLHNDGIRINIARAGFDNAYENHRWINRVDDLIRMLK